LPFLVTLLSFVGWYIYGIVTGVPFFDKRVRSQDSTTGSHITRRNSNSRATSLPSDDPNNSPKSTPKDRFIVTVGVILYLVFPTLIGGTFKMFDCRGVGKEKWLHVDMEESCSGDRYLLMRLLLGFSQLFLYVCGLPLLTFCLLVRNRERLHTLVVQSRYGLFFAGYVFWWWWCMLVLLFLLFVVFVV
jgi:hypothetical protein